MEKFRKVIDDMGAELIECKIDDTFDPEVHEAVGIVQGDEKNNGTISQVVQNGYRFGEVIVRPTRVIVYKMKIT